MTIDFSQLNTYYIVLLPVIVSFVAGVIRQDKLPAMINEGISYAVALILSAMQALFGGKLGGSPLADFGIVTAYTMALLHGPLFQKLQQAIQTKVASVGPAPQAQSPLSAELQNGLASLLSSHLQGVTGLLNQFLDKLSTQPPASSQAPTAQQAQFQPMPWQQQEPPFLGRPNTANMMSTDTFPRPVMAKQ